VNNQYKKSILYRNTKIADGPFENVMSFLFDLQFIFHYLKWLFWFHIPTGVSPVFSISKPVYRRLNLWFLTVLIGHFSVILRLLQF
jgi:hypothetical protein